MIFFLSCVLNGEYFFLFILFLQPVCSAKILRFPAVVKHYRDTVCNALCFYCVANALLPSHFRSGLALHTAAPVCLGVPCRITQVSDLDFEVEFIA
jgi:hypothetical protein